MASATPSETLSALLSLVWPRPTARACPRASPTAPSGLPRLRSSPAACFMEAPRQTPRACWEFQAPKARVALSWRLLLFCPFVSWLLRSPTPLSGRLGFHLYQDGVEACIWSPRVELGMFGDVWGLATGFRRQQCLLDLPGSILMPLCEASCWAQAPVVIGQPSVSVGPRAWPSSCVRLCVKAAQGSAVTR